MADPKLLTLVTRLLKRTSEGKITWQVTNKEDVYEAQFSNFTVRLFYESPDYIIQIFNNQNELIEELKDTDFRGQLIEGEGYFTAFDKLYKLARRQAHGVERAIDRLLAELGD